MVQCRPEHSREWYRAPSTKASRQSIPIVHEYMSLYIHVSTSCLLEMPKVDEEAFSWSQTNLVVGIEIELLIIYVFRSINKRFKSFPSAVKHL